MRIRTGLALAGLLVAAATTPSAHTTLAPLERPAQELPVGAGGSGTLYIGGWPNYIYIIDEATERVSGHIELQAKTAPRTLLQGNDKSRFYVLNSSLEEFEVVDIPTRRSLKHVRLSEGRRRVVLRSAAVDPLERFVVLLVKVADKKVDHFVVTPSTLVVYDLQADRVSRTIAWPDGEERESANLLFSPDGKYLYFFSSDVLVYDTTTFEEVDRWELSRPLEEGMGTLDFGPTDSTYEQPGFYTSLFRVRDPIQNRDMMGIAHIDLLGKTVDFSTLGPAERVSFAVAPDRTRAYGLKQAVGDYEFWTFDLESRRLLKRASFAGRPRMSLRTSSNGRVLYIFNAGNTIDLYEADTYRYLRTITLDGDTTTPLIVVRPEDAS